MKFEVSIGFDSRAYATIELEVNDIDELENIDYRGIIQNGGVHVEYSDFDMPLNINVISATDEEDEHHHIDHEIADTLNITGHTCLSTNEVRELITAIESGTAYNSDVYNNLRKQLAEVDDKPTA